MERRVDDKDYLRVIKDRIKKSEWTKLGLATYLEALQAFEMIDGFDGESFSKTTSEYKIVKGDECCTFPVSTVALGAVDYKKSKELPALESLIESILPSAKNTLGVSNAVSYLYQLGLLDEYDFRASDKVWVVSKGSSSYEFSV